MRSSWCRARTVGVGRIALEEGNNDEDVAMFISRRVGWDNVETMSESEDIHGCRGQ